MSARRWLALMALAVALPAAADLDPALRRELERAGRRELTVIVTMRPAGRAMGGGSVVERLAATAEASQRELLRDLAHRSAGARQATGLKVVNAVVLTGPPELIRQVAERDDVAMVYGSRPVALVAPSGSRAARAAGEPTWGLQRIGAPRLHRAGLTGRGVTVGSLDSGADLEHPALRGRLARDGWRDFVDGRSRPYDDNGHGTHTLGTMAGAGGIGVAPEAEFLVAKVLDRRGQGDTATLLRAMDFMLDPDGDPRSDDAPVAVNNSWGGEGTAPYFQDAIASWLAAGITPVFAIGNSGPGEGTTGFPGNYPDCLGVGALDERDQVARFSSRGPVTYFGRDLVKPDVTAPGVGILSAQPNGRYATFDGTSAAAPHVAGAVALLKQARPQLTVDQVRDLLTDSAFDLGRNGLDNSFGSGRIDLARAAGRLGYDIPGDGGAPPGQPGPRPPYDPRPPYPPQPRERARLSLELRGAEVAAARVQVGVVGDPFTPLRPRLRLREEGEDDDDRDPDRDDRAGRNNWTRRGAAPTAAAEIDLDGYGRWLDGRQMWFVRIQSEVPGQVTELRVVTAGGTVRPGGLPFAWRAERPLEIRFTPRSHAAGEPPFTPRPPYLGGTYVERLLPRSAVPGRPVVITYRFMTDARPPLRVTITEQAPTGWRVAAAEPEPLWVDPWRGQITWRLLQPRGGTVLRLTLEPPAAGQGWVEFAGSARIDTEAPMPLVGEDRLYLGAGGDRPDDWVPLPWDDNGDGLLDAEELLRWIFGRR